MYSFSTDGEMYRGRFETIEEAVQKASFGIANGVFWVGECRKPADPASLWNAEDWLEYVSVQDDYQGEWAEDWDASTDSERQELEEIVRKAMGEWLDRHDLRAKHSCIDEAQQYRIVEGVVSLIGVPEL